VPILQAALSHRWSTPSSLLSVTTSDGLRISGSVIGDPSPERPAIVLCHGLLGWHRKPRIARFGEALTPWATVFLPDLRGHGRSEGICSYGVDEIEDVEAVVHRVRERGHALVATVGVSMGAIAVVRHAALIGGVDAVVAISTLARWGPHDDSPERVVSWRRMRRFTDTGRGRRVLAGIGTRLPERWDRGEAPEEVVAKLAPTPLLIVHGRDDHLFGPDEAIRLFEAAGEPKRLLLADRFGHAEDGLGSRLARRVARELVTGWGLPWHGPGHGVGEPP
jgi:pimeloyl-ACP methyl ester carboxylesterase